MGENARFFFFFFFEKGICPFSTRFAWVPYPKKMEGYNRMTLRKCFYLFIYLQDKNYTLT